MYFIRHFGVWYCSVSFRVVPFFDELAAQVTVRTTSIIQLLYFMCVSEKVGKASAVHLDNKMHYNSLC